MKTTTDRLIAVLTTFAIVVLPVNSIAAPGDFNFDGNTDYADLSKWETAFSLNTTNASDLADGDGDYDSDGTDFLIWQQAAAGGEIVAPEPATVALTMPFIIFMIARRHRPATYYRFDEAHPTLQPAGIGKQMGIRETSIRESN